MDSVIGNIASAYHIGLGLPADVASWIRSRNNGYSEVATKVASIVERYPMIAASLARRYPVVICDEHQDSSADQHAIVMSLLAQGARVRIFADPMQTIFRDKGAGSIARTWDWETLKSQAQSFAELDLPHRWSKGCSELGAWTLTARATLKSGGKIDLREPRPPSVVVLEAENLAQRALDYRLIGAHRKGVDTFEKDETSILVLTRHNQTARGLRSFFYRRILLWEGHTRSALEQLVDAVNGSVGKPGELAAAVTVFLTEVGKGFSPSGFGNLFEQEAMEDCKRPRRGKAATIQELARFLVMEPNHRGIAKMLRRLSELRTTDAAFSEIEIDCQREFWEAIRLGQFDTPDEGLAEITRRRSYSHPEPPPRAISTVHKAKGLECEAVIVMPCDGKTFPDKPDARCLLYVALSRATSRLLIVVSRTNPSPLIII
jgi:DNA helicase-2/ATP-dependent DNA helicase PcrA